MRALVLALLVSSLLACAPAPATNPAAAPTTAGPLAAARPSPSAAPSCRTPWSDGLRRPERFTLVAECVVITGTVRHVKSEQDGDSHVQVILDSAYDEYLNAANRAKQSSALVWEIEPWQLGKTSSSLGADKVNGHAASAYCNAACSPQPGDYVRITSAIVTDNEGGHGWNEAHAPSNVELVGHNKPPTMEGIEHPSDEPGDDG